MKSFQRIFIVATIALYSCGGGKEQSQTALQDEIVLVKALRVSEQPVEQLTELTGNIEAYRVNHIVTTMS